VSLDVDEFVQQREPEVVDAIMPQGECNDRDFTVQHRCPVQVSLVKVPFEHQGDAVIRQVLLRQQGAGIKRRQSRQIANPL